MPDLSSLKNNGLVTLNKPSTPQTQKTVVVLGVARGGTTMVASVLQALGVYMGEKLGSVLEDINLSQAVETRDMNAVQTIVSQRNSTFPVWGWKRPAAVEYSDIWMNSFRNPYIIAVFRDPFAISNRNRISMLNDLFQDMERSVQHLEVLTKFLRKQECPLLLCSYEKVLASPETFVKAVDSFLDLKAEEHWPEAAGRIEPAPEVYLQTSRITNSKGHLDVVNEKLCAGWAFYPQQPNKAAKVQIFINNVLCHVVEADRQRPDVKEKNTHPTGLCGFRFDWPPDKRPQLGDRIVVQVEGDIKPIHATPMVVSKSTNFAK